MRRYRHRYSKDIDLFVPDPQYLGHLDPELNDDVAALTPKHLKEANYLRLYFPEGEVDFIAAAPVTDAPRVKEDVLGRTIQVDTSIEIVGKKIRYRAAEFTARDIFDFALIAEKEAKELPKIKSVLDERGDAIVQRLTTSDKTLRTTFEALDTLDYKPTYEHCVGLLKKALGK